MAHHGQQHSPTNIPPFPVTTDDIAASIAASLQSSESRSSLEGSVTPKRFPRGVSPPTSPGSARGTPPPVPGKLALGGSGFVNLMNLAPGSVTNSRTSSRRPSATGTMDSLPLDSRRGSVKSMATDAVKDMRKGVKNVADTTKKATHKMMGTTRQLVDGVEEKTKKVKDKTAGMSAHMKDATKGASKWVASQTSKRAKAAMDQAKSGLSGGEKFTLFAFEKMTLLSRKGFTHVFMFLILIGYTALGALLFMAVEAPHEDVEKLAIQEERLNFIKMLWDYNGTDYQQYVKDAKRLLLPLEDQLYKGFSAGVSSDTDVRDWTFWKAVFFCSTITTTIGYGHITPKTTAGQALTVIYALIGIPLFLILMADFGKLFTRLLKALFIFIRKCYRSAACVRLRKHKHVKVISSNWTRFIKFVFCRWKDDEEEPTDEEEGLRDKKEKEAVEKQEAEDKYFQDGNFNLPISLALFILIVYMLAGCFVYITWEPWTLFEAFYFIFVSMTTIGFGDFVPEHPAFMMATVLYLVFGLALTAMCINIIQEKLTDTFREASKKLKESFSHIMANQAAGQEDEDPDDTTPSVTTLEITEVPK